MTSNPNLDILMEKIFDHEDVVNRIMETDDMFELYSLCQKIQKGYTFEEFLEFFEDLVYVCLDEAEDLKEELEKNTDKIKEVEEKQLSDVSGGVSGTQKLAASALASLMFATPAGAASPKSSGSASSNAGVHLGKGKSEDLPNWLNDDEDEKPQKKVSLGEKIKNGFNKFLDGVWNNKGKILLSSAALLGGGAYLASQSGKLSDNLKDYFENKDEIKRLKHKRNVLTSTDESINDKRTRKNKLDEEIKSLEDEKKSLEEEIESLEEKPQDDDGDDEREKEATLKRLEEKLKRLQAERYELDRDVEFWDANHEKKDMYDILSKSIKVKEGKGLFSRLTSDLSGVATLATIGGGVATAISALTKLVNKGASMASDVNNLRYYWTNSADTVAVIREQIKIKTQIEETKGYNSEEGRKKLRGAFDSMVRGQEGAKDQIMSFFTQFVSELEAGKIGASSSELPPPKVLVFNGPSGTGKTYMAKLLSAALTKVDPYIVTANDVLDASRASYGDMSYGFLYGNTKQGSSGKDGALSNMNMNTLASYLKATEGTVRVVVVDEWDKLYRKDNTGRFPETHALDETFRSIIDNRLKDHNGNYIDLTGAVFICTTNETTASLQGRIKVDEIGVLREVVVDEDGNPVLDGYGEAKTVKPIKDRTGTQTVVPHDGSLMARLSGSICYFDELKVEDYEDIARDALGDDRIIRNADDYIANGKPNKVSLRERLTHHGLGGIIISDKGYELISEYAAEMKNGARSIVGAGGTNTGSVSSNLSNAVSDYISRLENEGKSYHNLMLWAKPEIGRDSTGRKVVKFDIEAIRYDDYDNYDKCLEDCNKKEAEEVKNEQETVLGDEQPGSVTVG